MVGGCTYTTTIDLHRVQEGQNGGQYTPDNTFMLCPNHHAEHHRGVVDLRVVGPFQLEAVPTNKSSQWAAYGI